MTNGASRRRIPSRSLRATCVIVIVTLCGSYVFARQSRESAQNWVDENYVAVLNRVLPLGDWAGDPTTKGAAWRVAFRARGDGQEWLVVLVGRDGGTTANVTVVESPIEEQLRAQYLQRKGKLSSPDAKVNLRRWQLAEKGCEAVERAVKWMLQQGVRLAQPSEFAMDGPIYDVKAEAVNRLVLVNSQGFGTDAQLVDVMKAVRSAAQTAQCAGK